MTGNSARKEGGANDGIIKGKIDFTATDYWAHIQKPTSLSTNSVNNDSKQIQNQVQEDLISIIGPNISPQIQEILT